MKIIMHPQYQSSSSPCRPFFAIALVVLVFTTCSYEFCFVAVAAIVAAVVAVAVKEIGTK